MGIIKTISAYSLGILFMITISGFLGLFIIGFCLNDIFFNMNNNWMWIMGFIVSILVFIGIKELFVWEMIKTWID